MTAGRAPTGHRERVVAADAADPLRLHIGGETAKDGWKILNIQPGAHVDFAVGYARAAGGTDAGLTGIRRLKPGIAQGLKQGLAFCDGNLRRCAVERDAGDGVDTFDTIIVSSFAAGLPVSIREMVSCRRPALSPSCART